MTQKILNPKRPQKKAFIKLIAPLSRADRADIINELIPLVLEKKPTKSHTLHTATANEMDYIIKQFKRRNRLSDKQIFKLYVVGCYPMAEVNHWIMTKSQVYRMKKPQRDKWIDTSTVRRKRSVSIYDINGDVIPMRWRTKHLPGWVDTQQAYDKYMTNPKFYNDLDAEYKRNRAKKDIHVSEDVYK